MTLPQAEEFLGKAVSQLTPFSSHHIYSMLATKYALLPEV